MKRESSLYEIIVVDNNSTDDTKQVVLEFAQQHSGLILHYVLETEQGLSSARNRGIKFSKGDIIAFIDDDVLVDVNYLNSIVGAFEKPGVEVIAGRVLLAYEFKPAIWLSSELQNYLSKLDLGEQFRQLDTRKEWMVGANMVFARQVFNDISFSTDLGRKKNNLLSGEETLLMNAIIKSGRKIWYSPEVALQHIIPLSRSDKSFFTQRAYWGGFSKAIIAQQEGQYSIKLPLLSLLKVPFNYMKWLLSFKSDQAFTYLVYAYENLGIIKFALNR